MEQLEKYFDTAFEAPDGVKKLRELILTLAMQGKLNQKNSNGKSNGFNQQKDSNEVPYELPIGWKCAQLGEFTNYNGRKNINGSDISPETWVLDLEDIEKSTSKLLCKIPYKDRQSKSTKSTFKKGDVLYSKLRPYLDKVIVADEDGVCTTEIVPIVPNKGINSYFLRWLLKRPAFLQYVNSLMYGIKMPRIGTEDAIKSIHPIPPFDEQKEIVSKIEELMSRCDELEKLRTERDQRRLAVHSAAIRKMLDAPDQETFDDAWQFITRHFGELYTVRENVAELRKAILQLAVRGKLVKQDPKEGTARYLLEEIEREKRKIIKTGKNLQSEPLPSIQPTEMPYKIPKGWEWVRFEVITINRDSERVPVSKEIRTGIKGKYDYYGASGIIDKVNDYLFDKSLLLIGEDGANLINRSTPIAFMAHGQYWVNNHAHVIDAHEITLLQYLEVYINSIDLKPYVTGSAQPKMNQAKMNSIPIALPPLNEQKRIIAKVAQLMAYCGELEKYIDVAREKQGNILGGVMNFIN